ncbi:MAG: amino acid ABC transporter permease [Deltaproteobacteria bacterium]|nr:amino acid ABC transporter permease [Deltaproteobacteria bacterium]
MTLLYESIGLLFHGLKYNILLTSLAVLIALPISCLFAVARMSRFHLIYYPATLYINILRSSPLLMVLFWVYYTIPMLIGREIHVFYAALAAIAAFEVAYFAEFIRSGIQSISVTQCRAGLATGLSSRQVTLYIILPQALRKMLPSLLTQSIIAFQDSTLASVIGVREIFQTTKIINSREMKPVLLYLFLAIVYFIMCYSLSRLVRGIEKRTGSRISD